MKRTLVPVLTGLLIALAAVQPVAAAPGGGASFSVSPTALSFSSPIGSFTYGLVTVTTGRKAVALANPATSTDPRFVDTQAGSCWQQYGAQGLKVPLRTSCTVQVRFVSMTPGTFAATLSIAECLKWHLDASGGIACDSAGGSQSVALSGTATQGLADLFVLGVVLGNLGPTGDATYRIDVGNRGPAFVEPGVYVEARWSIDDVVDFDDPSACSGVTLGPIAPGSDTSTGVTPVFITCPTLPTSAEQFLIVDVDHGNTVEESDDVNNVRAVILPPH